MLLSMKLSWEQRGTGRIVKNFCLVKAHFFLMSRRLRSPIALTSILQNLPTQ